MDFSTGNLKILYIEKTGGYVPIGCLTGHGFSEEVEMLDTTTRDNAGWSTSRPTNQSYNIDFDGLITDDLIISGKITYKELRQLKRSRELLNWKIEDDNGNTETGQGYITSLSDTANINEYLSFSGSLLGYGKPSDPILEIYEAYENRTNINGGEIQSESCQIEFIKTLL